MPDAIIHVFPEPVIAGTIVRLRAEPSRDGRRRASRGRSPRPTTTDQCSTVTEQGASMGYDQG